MGKELTAPASHAVEEAAEAATVRVTVTVSWRGIRAGEAATAEAKRRRDEKRAIVDASVTEVEAAKEMGWVAVKLFKVLAGGEERAWTGTG